MNTLHSPKKDGSAREISTDEGCYGSKGEFTSNSLVIVFSKGVEDKTIRMRFWDEQRDDQPNNAAKNEIIDVFGDTTFSLNFSKKQPFGISYEKNTGRRGETEYRTTTVIIDDEKSEDGKLQFAVYLNYALKLSLGGGVPKKLEVICL